MLRFKATPEWTGIPPEVKEKIVKNLSVIDKATLRNVSKSDRAVVDNLPLKIDKLTVIASSDKLKVKIREPYRKSYDLKPITKLLPLLKNPNTFIEKLKLLSGSGPFGDNLQKFYKIIRLAKFKKESVKMCEPHYLENFKVTSTLSDDLWMKVIATEQFKNSKQVAVTRSQNYLLPLFDEWNGHNLQVDMTIDDFHLGQAQPLSDKIIELFKSKPRGSSFAVRTHDYTISMRFAQEPHQDKFDSITKQCNSLYVYYGLSYTHGFVRKNDKTPEGPFTYDRATEPRRHLGH
uniref:F-box domain-containing protein n=1 Tax=Caenorhabditis tropicalis TaxID=1561998 RepID=A0A1I7V2X4_9PELO